MLRRARLEDADALAAIHGAAIRDAMPWLAQHTPEEDSWFLRELVLPNEEVWVAEIDGRPVGFVSLGVRDGEAFLQHIYVAPESQRRGFGNTLFEHAKALRPEGFRLWVFQRNEGARRFYERHGCRHLELTDGRGNAEQEPDALYEWVP